MDTEYETSRIEHAKRDLYSTNGKQEGSHKTELSPSDIEVANNWGDTEIITERHGPKRMYGVGILKILVVLAVATTFISGGYLLYQVFDPLRKPSDKNILITFDVPVGVTPGVPADVLIRVSNQNRVALEFANLTVTYPSGTKNGSNTTKDFRDDKKLLGTIAPGEIVDYQTKAIFLGEEGVDKELGANLEYRFEGMNSVFKKSASRPIHLLASPINLTVDALRQVNAGQKYSLGIIAASNTVIPLQDVLVKVDYPQGFTYVDADPKPSFGNNIWRIGTMDPAEKFTVDVHGILSGVDTQEKVFYTTVGVGNDQTERAISTTYAKVLSSTILQRPFIGIRLLLGGVSAEQAVAHFGENISGTVEWVNNLPTKVVNAQIEVRLSGVALNRSSIRAGSGGFYRSSDDTIFWDERGDAALTVMESGENGSESFTFSPMPSVTGNQLLTNPSITAEVTVRGKRISEAGVPEEIKTVMTQSVKITSQAQFASRAVYYEGPFVNTGPIPPRVEQETSYTILWSIRNTSNMLANAEVHAILPVYMTWSGSVFPGDENIRYNPTTHEIVWSPGDIAVGTGVGKPPRSVAFQVILTPSLSQVRTTPTLLSKIRFSGTDSFTGELIEQTSGELTTLISTDPKAVGTPGIVAP